MGVNSLWSAIGETKENVLLDVLRGKKVAVDSSIWLYQFLKARPEAEHAPLVGFTSRIIKLLFYDVRPVFVFDGPAPSLKKRVLQARSGKRCTAGSSSSYSGIQESEKGYGNRD